MCQQRQSCVALPLGGAAGAAGAGRWSATPAAMRVCSGRVRVRDGARGGRSHRHVRLELPALGKRALSTGTPPAGRLGRFAQRFPTAELNASFYRWPRTATFAGWRARPPPGFELSVKASRGLTHAKRLYAPEGLLDRIASCWHELGDRRGVVLFQLAPQHQRDDARLEYLLQRVPEVDAGGGRTATRQLAG